MSAFIKFDGIDGEAADKDHDKWIDVLSMDWGAHKPGGGATGQSRRRGGAIVDDFSTVFEYEKAAPKLQEKCLLGEVIPKVEIHLTSTYGGARATYLKFELTNVMVTSFNVNAAGNDDAGPPTVQISNNFEEMKVEYTEYDDTGKSQGNVDTSHKVGKGES